MHIVAMYYFKNKKRIKVLKCRFLIAWYTTIFKRLEFSLINVFSDWLLRIHNIMFPKLSESMMTLWLEVTSCVAFSFAAVAVVVASVTDMPNTTATSKTTLQQTTMETETAQIKI